MNTGIMDAHNLAWKLALVADGGASDELLNTYEQERRPVAANVLGLSHAIVRWHHMNHPVKRALLDALVPAITRLPALQTRATRRLSQISVAYPSSPLTSQIESVADPSRANAYPTLRCSAIM
jgi:2-polyprenyl-6-methoxyphenol hydroxylase-like FAD-dependent oxidoreductase